MTFKIQSTPFNSGHCGTLSQCPRKRESVIAGVYFSQTSVAKDLATVRFIGASVMAGCPQGES